MAKMIKTLSFWLSMLSILGCYFNVLKNPISWIIWEGTAIGFSYHFLFRQKDYGSAVVWIFYIFFDAFGYAKWVGWL